MSDLMLDVDQAGELKAAFRRGDWTNEQIKRACEGNFLSQVRKVLTGDAKIVDVVKEVVKKVFTFTPLPTVISTGRSGAEWVTHLKEEKFNLSNWAIDVMTKGTDAKGNLAFIATNGVVYKPVVIKGEEFEDDERITSNIRKVATDLKLITPPAELEPLIREAVSDEDMAKMGLDWLVTMHEPIIDSDGDPLLLSSNRNGVGRGLYAFIGRSTDRWRRRDGFVFLAPQD